MMQIFYTPFGPFKTWTKQLQRVVEKKTTNISSLQTLARDVVKIKENQHYTTNRQIDSHDDLEAKQCSIFIEISDAFEETQRLKRLL